MPIFWSPACHSQWTRRRIRRGGGGIPGEIYILVLDWLRQVVYCRLLLKSTSNGGPNPSRSGSNIPDVFFHQFILIINRWFVSQVFRKPWPGIMRGVYGNQERFESTYFQKFPGFYVTGDGNAATHPLHNQYEWMLLLKMTLKKVTFWVTFAHICKMRRFFFQNKKIILDTF